MKIKGTRFGSITIGRKTYEHDVLIRSSGKVRKRRKKLSRKHYGHSHTISREEAKFIYEKGCNQLILGTGQNGNLRLSPEAEEYFAKKEAPIIHARPQRRYRSGLR